MTFDGDQRPVETNPWFIALRLGRNFRPFPIREIKENHEGVAKAIGVSPFALRIQYSIVISTMEALDRKVKEEELIANENDNILRSTKEKMKKYLGEMDKTMEQRLALEQTRQSVIELQ